MYKAKGVSKGVVISKLFVIKDVELKFDTNSKISVEEEKQRFKNAIEKFKLKTEKLVASIAKNASQEEADILEQHIEMVYDPDAVDGVNESIESGLTAEASVNNVFDNLREMFLSFEDELMRSRATDIEDIKASILRILTNTDSIDVESVTEECIVVKHDFTPSDTGQIDKNLIKGIISEVGGITSHTAIIARAMEIPAVLGISNFINIAKTGDIAIIDGEKGTIILNPSEDEIKKAKQNIENLKAEKLELQKYKNTKATTSDDYHVEVFANIGGPDELKMVIENGADGIGLFRTELIFMDRNTIPTEDEQFEMYKEVAVKMEGKPIIIRTLDIGGDKEVPYLNLGKEDNPFLGLRAVRLCLAKKELFKPQILALLRASEFGDIKIMIPLISTLHELQDATSLIEECKKELDSRNIKYNKDTEIGIMIETPASSLISDVLAKECKFFSIGTNDLTQYTMAVDRGNKDVSYLYNTYDPAVIRSIYSVVVNGKKENIMVGMCGEAAGDPLMIPFLLAIGLDEFSVNASSILETKRTISKYNLKELQEKIPGVLKCSTSEEVKDFLKKL